MGHGEVEPVLVMLPSQEQYPGFTPRRPAKYVVFAGLMEN